MALEPQEKLPGMWQQEEPMTGSTRQCTRHQYCMQQCARVTITRSYFEISFSRGKQSESLRNRPLKFGPFEVFGPLGPAYHVLSGRPIYFSWASLPLSEEAGLHIWGGRPLHFGEAGLKIQSPEISSVSLLKSIICRVLWLSLLKRLVRATRRWLRL